MFCSVNHNGYREHDLRMCIFEEPRSHTITAYSGNMLMKVQQLALNVIGNCTKHIGTLPMLLLHDINIVFVITDLVFAINVVIT